MTQAEGEGGPRASSRHYSLIWGREIPFRNPHFTGREPELKTLRDRLVSDSEALLSQPPQALYGLGGVGKTEIAAEYAHRFGSEYDIVWWVRAEQEDTIRDSLVNLGRRLRLPGFEDQQRDYFSSVVLDALRTGNPYDRWLLIFDNAAKPEVVGRYIPHGTGHVIITSRISEWRRTLRTDGIEVAKFALAETVEFLRRRVAALMPASETQEEAARQADAERLANALDNLPLAAEHAAAYLTETGTAVADYLELYRRNAHELFGTPVDIYYAHPVASTWSVSRGTISEEADALFLLLSFFAPEPISEELLVQPGRASDLPASLDGVLGDVTAFRRAVRELARFSLVKIDGVRNVVQVHRVVQAVTRGRLKREDERAADVYRDTAHMLLAASDPGSPDKEQNDPIYHRSRQHIVASDAMESGNPHVRTLVINQVRRMHLRGGYRDSLIMGERALDLWRGKFGADDLQTLALAVEVAIARDRSGRTQEAYELNTDTLERLRATYGEENEVYLKCARRYANDLRTLGRYAEALELDMRLLPLYERIIRAEHDETMYVRNNIAIDLRCVGRFEEALRIDEETYAQRERTLGYTALETLSMKWSMARDLRRLGRYEESLDMLREVNAIAEDKNEPWHLGRLQFAADLAVALRRVGFYPDARTLAEDVLQRSHATAGPLHRHSLVVATNLITDRRVTEDLESAQELGESTLASWEKVAGSDHPNTCSAVANLAVVLRMRGNPSRARELGERAHTTFSDALGEEHPNTLVVAHNLASDLAVLGEVRSAGELGERTLEASVRTLGETHPCSLAAMANLSLDRRAGGDAAEADVLYDKAMAGYRERLTAEHPQARLAAQRGRVNLDIEPMTS